jgi:hypothetical protein
MCALAKVRSKEDLFVSDARIEAAVFREVEMLALAAAPPRGPIIVHERAWNASDCNGAAIAVADCADDNEAAAFATACRHLGELAQSKWRMRADVLHHHRPHH